MAHFKYKKEKNKNYLFLIVIILLLSTLLLLGLGVIGFRLNFFSISFSLSVLTKYGVYSAILTAIISLLSIGYYFKTQKKNTVIFLSIFSFIISSFIIIVFYGYIISLRSFPFMNDVSTNYDEIITYKVSKHLLPEKNSKLLQSYSGFNRPYSELRSLYIYESSIEEVFAKSIFILESMNLEIVYRNLDEGIIEAVDQSFWYGFKDDFIVRIEKLISENIKIDVRSASRLGKSDFGKNYMRIKEFLSNF